MKRLANQTKPAFLSLFHLAKRRQSVCPGERLKLVSQYFPVFTIGALRDTQLGLQFIDLPTTGMGQQTMYDSSKIQINR